MFPRSVYIGQRPKILGRRDKMGFPVPLKEWFSGPLRGFVLEIFDQMTSNPRPYINADAAKATFGTEARFSRKTWGLLSLEMWHQRFHDRAGEFRALLHAAD